MCFAPTLRVCMTWAKQSWLHLGGRLGAGLHLEVTQAVDMCRLMLRAAAVLKSPCPPLREPAEWVQRRHCRAATSAPAASQWSPINNPPTYSSVSLSLSCLSIALSFLSSLLCPNLFCLFSLSLQRLSSSSLWEESLYFSESSLL